MKNKIYYTVKSRHDLDDIWDYIAVELQNRVAAKRVIQRILDAVDRLEDYAELGAPLSSVIDVHSDYRFLICGNYMVFYRVHGTNVYVDRVLYARRNYLRALFSDLPNDTTDE